MYIAISMIGGKLMSPSVGLTLIGGLSCQSEI